MPSGGTGSAGPHRLRRTAFPTRVPLVGKVPTNGPLVRQILCERTRLDIRRPGSVAAGLTAAPVGHLLGTSFAG